MQKGIALKYYWTIIVISIVTAIGLNNLILMSGIVSYSPGYQDAAETIYSLTFTQQLLYTGILIPILEEMIFRGAVFRLLRKWIKWTPAMVISAILFGIYHWNLVQFIYATLCGLLLAYLYVCFGSFKAPVLSHMSMNLIACVFTEYSVFNRMIDKTGIFLAVTAGCAIVFGMVFVYIKKLSRNWMLQKC